MSAGLSSPADGVALKGGSPADAPYWHFSGRRRAFLPMASEQKTESPPTAPAAPAAAGVASAASAEPAEPAEPSDLMKAYMWSPPLLVGCRERVERAALMPAARCPRLLGSWLCHTLGTTRCVTQGSGSGAVLRPGRVSRPW